MYLSFCISYSPSGTSLSFSTPSESFTLRVLLSIANSVGSTYLGAVRVSRALDASDACFQLWVATYLTSWSFVFSNTAASFAFPKVKTTSSNPGVRALWLVVVVLPPASADFFLP